MSKTTMFGWVVGGLAVLFLAIQLVPYRIHNPPVTQAMVWPSAEVEALARGACYDCHSNEVVVPWYGHVAPVSWWTAEHVNEAREKLNFSELDRPQEDGDEAGEVIEEGEMPPNYYQWMHAEARLSDAQRALLVSALEAQFGSEHDEHDEH